MTDTNELHKHLSILRRREKVISRAIKAAGLPESRRMSPGFGTLIHVIVDQQVSTAAGAAIWAKLKKACGGDVTPRKVLALGETGLRSCGFSGQKTRYALGLAEAVAARKLNMAALERASDKEVRETLLAYDGVGPWTADIYLLFCLGHADAFPAGDLALQEAARMGFRMRARPDAAKLERLAQKWRPYRGVAAKLLWAYYGAMKAGREAKPAGA